MLGILYDEWRTLSIEQQSHNSLPINRNIKVLKFRRQLIKMPPHSWIPRRKLSSINLVNTCRLIYTDNPKYLITTRSIRVACNLPCRFI